MDIKKIPTEELMTELGTRKNVKSSSVKEGESIKVIVAGKDGRHERYIRKSGPATMLHIVKK